jgi:hypothetical protein
MFIIQNYFMHLLESQNKYQASLHKFSIAQFHFHKHWTLRSDQLCLFLLTLVTLSSTQVSHCQIPLQRENVHIILFSSLNRITSSRKICHFPVSFLLPGDVRRCFDSTGPSLDGFSIHVSHIHILGCRKLNNYVSGR